MSIRAEVGTQAGLWFTDHTRIEGKESETLLRLYQKYERPETASVNQSAVYMQLGHI
jgi:hypothetical protein